MKSHRGNIIFLVVAITMACFFTPLQAKAANVGDSVTFNTDQNFDAKGRSQVQAVLVKTTPSLHLYVDQDWWNQQDLKARETALASLGTLATEFDSKIYPILTSTFGFESKPGIDNDTKITILFHAFKEGMAGYFRSADEYGKLQVPNSNEREMIYISSAHVNDSRLRMLVAHEFTHVIAFNQKDRIHGVQEEVWLNEARAEYASTILGYDTPYEGSMLQHRVRDFLNSPSDSLTEWRETKYDYAIINLFTHYLVDHYGVGVLAESLQSRSVGIDSINQYLYQKGFTEDFTQIFTNWTITIILNECNQDVTYCYLSEGLGSFRINPALNFLPLSGSSSLSVTNVIKNWSANWQKIIGGNGDLSLDFTSLAGPDFKVPYIVFDKENNYIVRFLEINSKGRAHVDIPGFGSKYNSLVIITSLEVKFQGFDTLELSYPYTFTVSITGTVSGDDPALIERLLAQIDSLKKQIAALQAGQRPVPSCTITSNVYVGVQNKTEVRCLQQFLVAQGLKMYPEALVTGNFGILTKAAVIRFQQKYGIPDTGFVGMLTRAKIKELAK